MELVELQQNTKELSAFEIEACDDVRGWLLAVVRLQNVAHVLAARLLVQLHKSGEHFADGATSAPNWAAVRSGAVERELWARMRVADRLQQLPVAEAAAIDGELQPRHQQQLADCVRSFPELAARDDATLTDLARTLPMGALLCRRHHGYTHANDLTVKRVNGKANIYNPDGTLFEIKRWQLE